MLCRQLSIHCNVTQFDALHIFEARSLSAIIKLAASAAEQSDDAAPQQFTAIHFPYTVGALRNPLTQLFSWMERFV
jgi:hypothetical protein